MSVRVLYLIAIVLVLVYNLLDTSREVMQRGILEHDEGHALLNANTWHHIIRWVLSGGPLTSDAGSIANLRDTLHQQGGTLYSAGKFGYSLLLAVTALPWQVSQAQALLMAWVCGFMVCGLAALLAWQYSRAPEAALIAGVGCLMSPLISTLSREVSGTIWALMFGLAAVNLLHFGSGPFQSRRIRWAAGVSGGALLGYGFTCHFNLAPFILAAFVATGLHASHSRSGSHRIKFFLTSLIPAAIGSLGVLLAFEILTQIVDYRLRDVFPEYLSFFGEHRRLFFRDQAPMLEGVLYGDGAIGWGREAWMVYWNVAKHEGVLVPLLLICSMWTVLTVRRRQLNVASAAVLFFLPLAFWLGYVYRVERVMGMCVAAGWIFIGITAFEAMRHRSTQVASVAFVATILIHIIIIHEIIESIDKRKTPLPKAAHATLNYIADNGGQITAGSFDTGFAPLWKWTLIEQLRLEEYDGLQQHVDFSRFTGADIVFIDPSTWRRPSGEEFTITRDQAGAAKLVYENRFTHPPYWKIEIKDLRFSADRQTTQPAS